MSSKAPCLGQAGPVNLWPRERRVAEGIENIAPLGRTGRKVISGSAAGVYLLVLKCLHWEREANFPIALPRTSAWLSVAFPVSPAGCCKCLLWGCLLVCLLLLSAACYFSSTFACYAINKLTHSRRKSEYCRPSSVQSTGQCQSHRIVSSPILADAVRRIWYNSQVKLCHWTIFVGTFSAVLVSL